METDGFSKLQPGSFDGIAIPVVRVRQRTAPSVARHLYPYRGGQDLQFMGRAPIVGTILAAYIVGIDADEGGQNVLWPGTLTTLRNRIQEMRSGPLVIPTLGTIQARIEIDEEYVDTVREGSYVTINFEEDSTAQFAESPLTNPLSELPAKASELDRQLERLKIAADIHMPDLDSPGTLSDFSTAIAQFTGSLANFQDDLARPLRQADALTQRCGELLTTSAALLDPSNWQAVNAIKDLQLKIQDSVTATLSAERRLKVYVTPAEMSAAAVAQATGNTVADVLKLNEFDNANDIDAGEALFVYAA